MRTVFMMIGYTGSGKSTWAKQRAREDYGVKIVSPDAFRMMLNGTYAYHEELDSVITESCFDTARHCLDAGYDVIIDCGNLTKSEDRRKKWRGLPAERFIAVVMPMGHPPQWYVRRRMKAPHWTQVDWLGVVKREMKAYEPPEEGEFNEIWHIKEEKGQ